MKGRLAAAVLGCGCLSTVACATGPYGGRGFVTPEPNYRASLVCQRDPVTDMLSTQLGRLHVTVLDTTGESIQGAPVSVTYGDTELVTVLTDVSGRVRLQDLRPGEYSLSVGVPGFVRAVVTPLAVQTGCVTAVAVPLELGDTVD